MGLISRLLLIVVCFFAAIACYVFGVPVGGVTFILLGFIFEGLFWTGVFANKRKAPLSTPK